MIITTDRLILRPWRAEDLEGFVAMHADPEVMVDAPTVNTRAQSEAWSRPTRCSGTPTVNTRAQSEAKFARYGDAFKHLGFCGWALTRQDDVFLGYVGIMPVADTHSRTGS